MSGWRGAAAGLFENAVAAANALTRKTPSGETQQSPSKLAKALPPQIRRAIERGDKRAICEIRVRTRNIAAKVGLARRSVCQVTYPILM